MFFELIRDETRFYDNFLSKATMIWAPNAVKFSAFLGDSMEILVT